MKITTQKLEVTPLIFNENFKNESKMVFPQKQGGGGPTLGENSTKKMFFFIETFRFPNERRTHRD